ncbi:C40 family peptidase [Paenibacillus sp. GCM10012307]|uniref:C40 family peptidase n=1 Tax=Paenibacillus roseus TaxID=2798579 RepID=A0A934JBA1_9BACL|nr:C40 family peptidase [Paenibacillus roseus]MBJ6363665.1 C40 family peptidase [Paenibacillus roseus]
MLKSQLIQKVIITGLFAAIGLSATGIAGQAPAAYAASTTSAKADNIIAIGKKYLGTKYVFGAPTGITASFDCSSFTQYIYKKNGISLPRLSQDQAKKGITVKKANLQKGDLVFFKVPSRGKSIAHVAVYIGNNKILHTYGDGGVKFSDLNSPHWESNYVTARRVIS